MRGLHCDGMKVRAISEILGFERVSIPFHAGPSLRRWCTRQIKVEPMADGFNPLSCGAFTATIAALERYKQTIGLGFQSPFMRAFTATACT